MNILYPLEEIYKNYSQPMWWRNRVAQRVIRPIQKKANKSDFRVMDEEWDTLIILDGCREDLFREVVDISQFDSYETRISAGSATNEWTKNNFTGQALTDTVYVTGNPVVSRQVQTAFHAFIEVWRDGFDENHGTVPPEAVTRAAMEARKKYPHKRLIVHYLQPHYPFIGYPELRYTTLGGTDEIEIESAKSGASDVWKALGNGLVKREKVWEAYAKNLELVMKSADKLIETEDGKTIVTSDHGNLLGEPVSLLRLRLYGHPPYIHHPDLRKVPWAITGGLGGKEKRQVDADVEDQLRNLGYT